MLFPYRRFTLTTDPSMNKSKLALLHRRQKEEATARKQSRRLRRLFETLKEGDVVSGTVHSIVPEGVLITVDGMKGMVQAPSAFTMKGLIMQRDLPTQFEVPGPLSSAICVEMLRQDFYPGRRLQCSVLGINPKLDPRQQYQLKLLYESFEPKEGDSPRGFFTPLDDEGGAVAALGGKTSKSGAAKGASSYAKRGDGADWDSNDDEDSDYADDIDEEDEFDEDDADDEYNAERKAPVHPVSKRAPGMAKNDFQSKAQNTPASASVQKGGTAGPQSSVPEVPAAKPSPKDMAVGVVTDRHRELFEELCDKNGHTTLRRVKDSEYMKVIVESGQLTIDHVNKIILSCIGTKKTGIALEEFAGIVTRIEDTIRALSSRNRIKSTTTAESTTTASPDGGRRKGPGASLFDDPEILEDAEITYELLRGTDEFLSIAKLKEWTYLKNEMKSKTNKDGKLTPTDVENAIMLAYSDKFAVNSGGVPAPSRTSGKLNMDQFLIFIEAVDKFLNGIEIKLRDYYGSDDNDDGDEIEQEDEVEGQKASARTADKTKTAKAVKGAPKVKPAPKSAPLKKAPAEEEADYDVSEEGDEDDEFEEIDGEQGGDGDEEDEDDDGYFDEEDESFDAEEAMGSLYDLLRGREGAVTVKALSEWDFIQLVVKSGQLTQDALNAMITTAVGTSDPSAQVSREQFGAFMGEMDAVTENMESVAADDDE